MGLMFQLFAERLFGRKEHRVDMPGIGLSAFAILATWAILGSVYAIVQEGVEHHYLTFGLGVGLVPFLFLWSHRSLGPLISENILVSVWALVFITAVAAVVLLPRSDEVLHELEFFVFPFFLYLYLKLKGGMGRLAVLLGMAATAYLTHKLTGYMTAGLALPYIFLLNFLEARRVGRKVHVAKLLGFLGGLVLVMAAAMFMYVTRDSMPSGNTNVRLHQYAIALEEIRESPVFGQFYTGESGILYKEYLEVKLVPTHSDLLDVARQGGVVALAMFVIGYGSIVVILLRAAFGDKSDRPIVHATLYLSISALATIAVNPILLKPTFALTLWAFLALGCAVAAPSLRGAEARARTNAV
jgi:hypothetical protein